MRESPCVAWVTPIAATLAADRRDLISFAREAATEFWERACDGVPGWRNRDVLAHLAGGNDRLVQTILHAVIEHVPLTREQLNPDTDRANADGVAERRDWSIDRLIGQLERDGDELQALLAKLEDSHAAWRHEAFGATLRQFLGIVAAERHDAEHLEQLRAGVDARPRDL